MKKKYTIIFLHPYNTSIYITKKIFKNFINNKKFKNIKWIFPKAKKNKNKNSWFNYLTNYKGVQEDIIDNKSLISQRNRIIKLINKYKKSNYNNIILSGMSQGGCLAIDIANYIKCNSIFTVVAHRMKISQKKKIKNKWYSIISKNDNIFRKSWTYRSNRICTYIDEINSDHYLSNIDITNNIKNLFKKILI